MVEEINLRLHDGAQLFIDRGTNFFLQVFLRLQSVQNQRDKTFLGVFTLISRVTLNYLPCKRRFESKKVIP